MTKYATTVSVAARKPVRLLARSLRWRQAMPLSFQSERTRRSLSSTTTTTAANSAGTFKDKLVQQHRPLFPWRHEEGIENLIPRVMPGTKEYNTLFPLPVHTNLMACVFMQVPFMNVFWTKQWMKDLEQGMSFALSQGVAGITSNSFHVPLSDIVKDGGENENKISFAYKPENDDADNNNQLYCPQIEDMMARPLRNLFESAHRHGGADHLRIELELQPKEAYFHRLYGLPFVRKEQIEESPHLLQDLFVSKDGTKFHSDTHATYDFLYNSGVQQLVEYGAMETTMAAEGLVVCDERFCVWDAATGEVLQGYDDGRVREVGHVVTLERTSQTSEGSIPFILPEVLHLTDWQIVDIDDLVGPQKWFHVKLKPTEDTEQDNVS